MRECSLLSGRLVYIDRKHCARKIKVSLIVILVATILSSSLWIVDGVAKATTYYVSPTGSDSNSGTLRSPFLTIQKAANIVNAGDTVIVKDGTYTGGSRMVVSFTRSGTSDAWITFKSENLWGAKIDGRYFTSESLFSINGNYLMFEGFEFQYAKSFDMNHADGCHDIYWHRNKVHDTARYQIPCDSREAIYGNTGGFTRKASYNITFDGNIFYNIGRSYGGCPGRYDQNNDHALYLYGSHHAVINNIFYGMTSGWPIQLAPSAANISIINNTFASANPWRDGHIVLWGGQTDVLIENNIFYEPRNAPIRNSNCIGDSKISINNNLTTSAGMISGASSCLSLSNNIIGADPKFVDPVKLDLHLQPISPAIDKGAASPLSQHDFDKKLRPSGNGHDIGAYEVYPKTE